MAYERIESFKRILDKGWIVRLEGVHLPLYMTGDEFQALIDKDDLRREEGND